MKVLVGLFALVAALALAGCGGGSGAGGSSLTVYSGREEELVRLLEEREPFAFETGAASWRGRKIPLGEVRRFALSFGSCSFQEPMDHLRELKIL